MNDRSITLYKTMYLIRQTEEKIREHYMEDEIKTPCHLAVGGEAIAAGVIDALDADDQVFGTYRSHGVYLAKTKETDKFFAELYGKVTGGAKGKAGSMHLSYPEIGFLGTSAVVATTISVAVGAAFANMYQKKKGLVAVFFGDGAVDEGAFWESVNLACLKRVPILFICEDNDLAIHTSTSERHGYQSITKIVSQFACTTVESTSTDVEEIYTVTKGAIEQCRRTQRPAFLHLHYYRYYEHVGMNKDFNAGYRSEEEFKKWLAIDPLVLQRERLLQQGQDEPSLQKLEENIRFQITKSVQDAQRASFPSDQELFTDVYAT